MQRRNRNLRHVPIIPFSQCQQPHPTYEKTEIRSGDPRWGMLGGGVLRAVLCAKKRRGKDNRGKQHKWVVYSSRGLSCVYRVLVVVVACYTSWAFVSLREKLDGSFWDKMIEVRTIQRNLQVSNKRNGWFFNKWHVTDRRPLLGMLYIWRWIKNCHILLKMETFNDSISTSEYFVPECFIEQKPERWHISSFRKPTPSD